VARSHDQHSAPYRHHSRTLCATNPLCPAGATVQITELAIYLALCADWSALGSEAGWRPVVMLLAAVLPVAVWCRKIVEFC